MTYSSVSDNGAMNWKAMKENQARERKRENDLKKCEQEISCLESRNSAIDEEMALPENCTDIGRLSKLNKEKTSNEEKLEALYEQWEMLSE